MSNLDRISNIDEQLMGNREWDDFTEELLDTREYWCNISEAEICGAISVSEHISKKYDIPLVKGHL